MITETSNIAYLSARHAKTALYNKIHSASCGITPKILYSYINHSLTLAEYWSELGLTDLESKELSDLHSQLINTGYNESVDKDLRKSCFSFASSIHNRQNTIKLTKLN